MAHTTAIAHRAFANMGDLTIRPSFSLVGSAFTAATGIALLAFRLRLLSRSGVVAASMIGSAIFVGTGVRGSMTLLGYFLTSSFLGRLPRAASPAQRKGNQRDAIQVLANGGVPAILAALHFGASGQRRLALTVAFSSAIASAAADTWATEIGGRLGKKPRSIVTGRRVTSGTSGGVSLAGLAASTAGSAFIAAVSLLGNSRGETSATRPRALLAITFAGIAGSVVDSFLGATLQEVRYCEYCLAETERLIHDCGIGTSHSHGVSGWNNDVTNVVGILAGAIVGPALLDFARTPTSRATTAPGRILRS